MKKTAKLQVLIFVLIIVMAFFSGCGIIKLPFLNNNNNGSSATNGAKEDAKASEAPPQEVFIDGAKALISTDIKNLLTEKQDGASFLGMASDFFYDMDKSSNETEIAATISDIVTDGELSEETGNLSLSIAHNAKTGDSSLEVSLGQGSDTNAAGGIYIVDGTALLKSASADQEIIQYAMQDSRDKTFTGTMSRLFSGLLSDDGEAVSPDDNVKDREALADRFLDPWLTDTKASDYKDSKQTRSLLGKDTACRVITLDMSGQAAYDFLLKNMRTLDADAQFTDMNGILGGLFASDLSQLTEGADSGEADSATKQLISTLEALTAEEIAKVKFTVSVIYDGEKAIGLELEASTTEKAFKVSLLTYRKGLEHQLGVYLQTIDGASISLDLTKVSAGGGTYNIAGTLKAVDAEGSDAGSGQCGGTVTETKTGHEFNGNFSFDMQFEDGDGVMQTVNISADIALALQETADKGYDGTGSVIFALQSQEASLSMKLSLTLGMKKAAEIEIKPPMYLESNAVLVTDKKSLFEALGQDWSDVSGESEIMQGLQLIVLLIAS